MHMVSGGLDGSGRGARVNGMKLYKISWIQICTNLFFFKKNICINVEYKKCSNSHVS